MRLHVSHVLAAVGLDHLLPIDRKLLIRVYSHQNYACRKEGGGEEDREGGQRVYEEGGWRGEQEEEEEREQERQGEQEEEEEREQERGGEQEEERERCEVRFALSNPAAGRRCPSGLHTQ